LHAFQQESVLRASLAKYEGLNARQESEEGPVPQEPEYDEEAEWAPLPESSDEAMEWQTEAELAPLPDDDEEGLEVSVAPKESSGVEEPEVTIREIVLRRTIRVPVPVIRAVTPEASHPADLEDLLGQLRQKLVVPRAEPYTVVREGRTSAIVCGFCHRQFKTLKGWRIHTSKMHKQEGFCARCGHSLLLPPEFTAAQRTAAVELHALEWCRGHVRP
uniref:C2H2-type domain-containing protein n=1 Tax=Elaeophora elaphi TaxID=1147741 RepID=A0A0R3RP17_9BILA